MLLSRLARGGFSLSEGNWLSIEKETISTLSWITLWKTGTAAE
jgi:hypothetical protein